MNSVVAMKSKTAGSQANRLDRLLEIIKSKSYSNDREITLSSGRKSFLYFNMKPTMLDNEAAFIIANEILDLLPENADFIGGLEMGAVPIVSAICPVAHIQDVDIGTFFVRKKPKEHGAKHLVEGLANDVTLAGKRVVVVDDVTTTGASVVSIFETLSELGAEIIMVVSVVDREEGAVELFKEKRIPFQSLFKASDF